MKKLMIVMLALTLFIGGCSGVVMNAEYAQLLDKTTAMSAETAARATLGELTEVEKTAALVKQAETWRLFQDAKNGVKPGDVLK